MVWTADELGLAYERIDAGGAFGVVATPEYRRMNPNSLVPVIEDDGFVLWESNAIVRYLAAKHAPGALWPDDLRRRADVDRWMDWQATTFTPAMRDAFWQLVRVPPEKRDAAAVEASRAASEKAAAVLEAHLAGREFVAGERVLPGRHRAGVRRAPLAQPAARARAAAADGALVRLAQGAPGGEAGALDAGDLAGALPVNRRPPARRASPVAPRPSRTPRASRRSPRPR